jgi:hypothetical protein
MFDAGKGEAFHMSSAGAGLVTWLHFRIMETAMHGSFDRPRETVKSVYRNWGIGIFFLPVLVVIALFGLVMTSPAGSSWIAQAVQAEFANSMPEPEIAPTQLAQPSTAIRSARAN